MDAVLKNVAQEKLQEAWELIKPGLAKVKEHSASTWIAEDIYAELRAGRSTLHIAYIDGTYSGFVVLSASQAFDGTVLHIWCAFNAGRRDVLALFIPTLERMGRSIGARRITFWSPRKWERRISPYGFTMNQTEFVKELL